MILETSNPLPYIKPQCLGCKTFFVDNEQVSPTTPSYFDIVELPIKKPRARIELLRIICAFLSSKGGHIFLGIDSKNLQVKGINISTKQQDEFKFYIKQLLGKIHPKVDLSNKQEVQTIFVPVVTNGKEPIGKSIIKIIVKQGQRDRVYTYIQKVKVSNPKGGQPQQFELRYGFIMNQGRYLRLQGIQLLDQIAKKAKGQNQRCRFHQNCNPKPLDVDPSKKLICFKGFNNKEEQATVIAILKVNLNQQDIIFQQRYNEKDKVLILQFHTQQETQTVQKLINNNLSQLKQSGIKLQYEGVQFNSYVFKKLGFQISSSQDEISKDKKNKANKILFSISNYNIKSRDDLLKAIKKQLPDNFNLGVKFYNYSLNLQLYSQQSVRIIQKVLDRNLDLNQYSIKSNGGKLSYGKITGHIIVSGFTEKTKEDFRHYAKSIFQSRLKQIKFKNNEQGKLYADLLFDLKYVNDALDKLTPMNDFKSKDPKISISLQCS